MFTLAKYIWRFTFNYQSSRANFTYSQLPVKMSIRITVIALIVLVSASSCVQMLFSAVTKETSLKYETSMDSLHIDNEFEGLSAFINSNDGPSNVLLIHGLTNKEKRHFDYMVERLAFKLRLKLDANKKQCIDSGTTAIKTNRSFGFGKWELYRWHFTATDVSNKDKDVNFYFIYWSPITQPAKKFLLQYNKTDYRTRLAVSLKDSLFINLFGDLALFINDTYKAELYNCFTTSLDHIKGPIAVVGSGFGVQMMFEAAQFKMYDQLARNNTSTIGDSLLQVRQGINVYEQTQRIKGRDTLTVNGKEVKDTKAQVPYYNISKIFLINNQLPFTSMLTLDPATPAVDTLLNRQIYWAMSRFMRYSNRLNPGRSINKIDIVSFYDPNDPFGYRLPLYGDSIKVTNVAVNTAEYWTIDPRSTTEFAISKLKSPKAIRTLKGLIDQESNKQKILTNLTGPAEQSRTDFRVISAIAAGSDYPLSAMSRIRVTQSPRDPENRARKESADIWTRAKNSIGEGIIDKVNRKITVSQSDLPFTEPSIFKDRVPDVVRADDFKGIDQSTLDNSLTQIMTIHGVRTQEPDHFDELTDAIARKLFFYGDPISTRIVCTGLIDCGSVGTITNSTYRGTIKIHEYKGTYGKRLIVYNVYWSSIVAPPKAWLDSMSIYKESSVVTRLIKRSLINDGFTDIEMTFRQYRDLVEATIKRTYEEMNKDYKASGYIGGRYNSYYITGSLGTKLLLDFLKRYRHYNESVVPDVQARTKTWFMLTNQLIMTALKDIELRKDTVKNVHLKHDTITYEDFYQQTFGEAQDLITDNTSSFEIVAFNDPNDLMSFVVPDRKMGIGADGSREKIHNNYVNLASGFQVNMNALISYVHKADAFLAKKHRSEYDNEIEDLEKIAKGLRSKNPSEYEAACEMVDMLKIARSRFSVSKSFNPKTRKETDDEILNLLMTDPNTREEELKKKLLEKKRLYLSNLYQPDSTYDSIYSRHKAFVKLHTENRTISKASVRKLYTPGLLMQSLRRVSDNFLYQDFVVDFGTAHVGGKSNKVISELISHGFDASPKTVNNQNLYHRVHNARQDP